MNYILKIIKNNKNIYIHYTSPKQIGVDNTYHIVIQLFLFKKKRKKRKD